MAPTRERRLSFTSEVMVRGTFAKPNGAVTPIITVVCAVDELPGRAAFEACVTEDVLQFERFRCAVSMGRRCAWHPVEVDLANHVLEHEVADRAAMDAYAMELSLQPFSFGANERPPWDMHMVKATEKGEKSAIILRIHHCIGDGLSLSAALRGMLRKAGGERFEEVTFNLDRGTGKKDSSLLGYVKGTAKRCYEIYKALALTSVGNDSKLPAWTGPKPLSWNGSRTFVTLPEIPVDSVKALARKANVSFNDVVLSVTSGAIRRLLIAEGKLDPKKKRLRMRALMPFAMPRKPADVRKDPLRNRWSMVSVETATGVKDGALARLLHTTVDTTRLKNSIEGFVLLYLQNAAMPHLPFFAVQKTASDSFNRHSMVFTNVPATAETAYICGKRIESMQLLFPNLLPQLSFLSYAGTVYANGILDGENVPNPHSLPEHFVAELRELCTELDVPSDFLG